MGLLDRIRQKGAPRTPQEADQLALRQLAARGADLAQPRHLIHHLYFSSEADAARAADVIGQASWQVSVSPPDERVGEWSLRAEGHRVVQAGTVETFRAWFEQIAAELGGEYDGWEASAKP